MNVKIHATSYTQINREISAFRRQRSEAKRQGKMGDVATLTRFIEMLLDVQKYREAGFIINEITD